MTAMLSQVALGQASDLQKLSASTAAAGTAASVKEAKQAGVSPPGTSERIGESLIDWILLVSSKKIIVYCKIILIVLGYK